MHLLDWIIMAAPMAAVVWIGWAGRRYVRGVSDFLTAGRVAGRYVVSVAQGEAAMGLISLVAIYEAIYKSGFAYSFWQQLSLPVGMLMSLTGYCVYRFRETRAMTMGQFLEMRYSRSLRITAAVLQSISGILNYALFPAVGARFLIYFCDLPLYVEAGGFAIPTMGLLMAFFLGLAVLVAGAGGQITIMVTDCIQGLLSYPIYAAIVVYIALSFSWFDQMAPTLLDRPPGMSMLNPFDIERLRDFNLFYVGVGIVSAVLNRMTWAGTQGYNTAARNAHEQKMGGILGTWRAGFLWVMIALLGVAAYTFLNNPEFADGPRGARDCRAALAAKAFDDIAAEPQFDELRLAYRRYLQTGEMEESLRAAIRRTRGDESLPEGPEAVMMVGRDALRAVDPREAQVFSTIYGQMRVPMAIRYILPVGLLGLFCAVCIFLMVSTDTTYLHSWGSILVQDLIVPLRGDRPLSPHTQLWLLRLMIAAVALFAFFFSLYFAQVDYILMFFAITGAIWAGGAGIVIVGGLYWKRGTTPAAFAALITGSGIATAGVLLQQLWAGTIYPALVRRDWVEPLNRLLSTLSGPFEPYLLWRVTPDKFPINSQEIMFLAMLISVTLYVVVSLLTCRVPYNMERLLHRGPYRREGAETRREAIRGFRDAIRRLVGITAEYTRGDRLLAWSVFSWSFLWNFVCVFLGIVIWNTLQPWPPRWWATWFFIERFVIGGLIASVTTIWFLWGGTRDLIRLFRDLKERAVDLREDGRVIGGVSAEEADWIKAVESRAKSPPPSSDKPPAPTS